MKHIEKFESFNECQADKRKLNNFYDNIVLESIESKFNNSTYEEKIKMLIEYFGISEDEAYEICLLDTKFDELPDEIKYNDDLPYIFNESLLGDKLKKWFPESEERSIHNEIAKLIFNRIKDTFEYERLINPPFIKMYWYNLEETDSLLGYIEIKIQDIKEVFVPNYDLLIDGNRINCSTSIKSDIFKFLKNKSQLKEENDKKSSLLNLKNKYNI